MSKYTEIEDDEIEEITNSLFKVYSSNNNYITKRECKKILNDLFRILFEHKLSKKNFDCIYSHVKKDENERIKKENCEDITRALIVAFNVNLTINNASFDDKICIKIGKKLLPIYYYVKKE